ncbi:uncharacterized protein LOC143354765 [Halictus rubicundus]|uniref:uncharacterized protein LOC143354765 n=1 Tax=Halictus rubicundus TaxID=77578 RepID=UPI0040357F66
MIFSYIISCAFFLCCVQANLDILFDDAVCQIVDTEYVDPDCSLDIFEDSEYGSYITVHLEVKKKAPDITVIANVLGMDRTGEYTEDVGLSVTMDICESLAGTTPSIAHVFINALDMTSDNCPPEPGVYGKDHFVIDGSSGMPESFPGGKYFVNMTVLCEEAVLFVIGIYITVM